MLASEELLPYCERRQPGNAEQFLPVAQPWNGVTSRTIACSRQGKPATLGVGEIL